MSFSQDIKNEILNIKNKKVCCRNVQKIAELLTEGEDANITDLKKTYKRK